MTTPRRLLYLVTEDWYFLSHRLPMARAARDAGFEVVVATRVDKGRAAIEAEGFRVVPVDWSRRGGKPLAEIFRLIGLYRRERPFLVHHVALKPAVYGSLVARITGVPHVVNSIAGLGYAFIGRELKARMMAFVLTQVFRFLFGAANSWVVVQNHDDDAFFRALVGGRRLRLIPGSGVDAVRFSPRPLPAGRLRATLVGRMLWDKGVGEFAEAARLLRDRGVAVDMTLVGDPDPANSKSVPTDTLRQWQAEGILEWWGPRSDIAAVWGDSAIAVLPSYREGMPKALLEAAACGRPLVTTDVPGCRELVRDGHNGLLVRPQDAVSLAAAIERLVVDAPLRCRLGAAARADVEATYSDHRVAAATAALYRQMAEGVR